MIKFCNEQLSSCLDSNHFFKQPNISDTLTCYNDFSKTNDLTLSHIWIRFQQGNNQPKNYFVNTNICFNGPVSKWQSERALLRRDKTRDLHFRIYMFDSIIKRLVSRDGIFKASKAYSPRLGKFWHFSLGLHHLFAEVILVKKVRRQHLKTKWKLS